MSAAVFNASSVVFLDDQKLPSPTSALEWAVSPDVVLGQTCGDTRLVSKEKFMTSRINDNTSYFFTWFCKHFALSQKALKRECPICLESTTNSIELCCGHAFCRTCLVSSAELNFNSCALCRKEQVIDPDVLRALFETQRMANIARRMQSVQGGAGGAVAAVACVPAPLIPVSVMRAAPPPQDWSRTSTPSPRVGGSGKCVRGACTAGSISGSSGSCQTTPFEDCCEGHTEADKAVAQALFLEQQQQQQQQQQEVEVEEEEGEEEDAFGGEAAGGLSAVDLRRRWKKRALPLPTPQMDVGGLSAVELHERFLALRRRAACAGPPKQGPFPPPLPLRLPGSLPTGGKLSSSCPVGAPLLAPAADLQAEGEHEDEDGISRQELQWRWEWANRMGRLDGTGVGDLSLAELSRHSSRTTSKGPTTLQQPVGLKLYPAGLQEQEEEEEEDDDEEEQGADVGAVPVSELKERWLQLGLESHFAGGGVGGLPLPQLRERWASGGEGRKQGGDVGAAPVCEMKGRWLQLGREASFAGEGVGGLPLPQLKERWTSPYLKGGGEGGDVGAASVSEMKERWLQLGREALFAGEGVGALPLPQLRERWANLFIKGGGGGAEKGGDVGAASVSEMKERWLQLGREARFAGEGVGALRLPQLRERWANLYITGGGAGGAGAEHQEQSEGSVGAMPVSELGCRWEALLKQAVADESVGGLSLRDVRRRWMESGSSDSVGAFTPALLKARWEEVQPQPQPQEL